MGGKKKDFKIQVKSLGNSTTGVTGSMWTVEYPKNDGSKGLIAIECGLCQSEPTTEKLYNSNKKMLENIGKDVVKKCEYVFLGHSHIDHLGSLPYFCRDNGFQGKILGSKETIEIGKELIKDSVYIHKKSLEYLNSKGIKAKALYTQSQMYEMFTYMEYATVGEKIKLNNNLTVEFKNNSHTVGSTNITLIFTKPNNEKKVIVYSSDMGSQINKKFSYYLKEQDIPLKCNLFISEATYSDYGRQMTKEMAISEREDMKNMIKDAILHNRRVLLPVFAFSKAQLMVTLLWEWFHEEQWFNNIPVVMDGLLMSNITNVYSHVLEGKDKDLFDKVMEWKNIKINKMYDSTIATLSQRICGVYLVSSGFLKEGHITTYLPQFLESSNDIIAINGYCGDENSRGGQLLNKAVNVIKIDKQFIQKRCRILQYKSFSSHITRLELLELWSKLCCDKIIIHHCDDRNKSNLLQDANEYLRSKNKTTKIVAVDKNNYSFEL